MCNWTCEALVSSLRQKLHRGLQCDGAMVQWRRYVLLFLFINELNRKIIILASPVVSYPTATVSGVYHAVHTT